MSKNVKKQSNKRDKMFLRIFPGSSSLVLYEWQTIFCSGCHGYSAVLSFEDIELKVLFEKAFLIKTVTPFFTNKRLEIVKNPKIYFLDIGLRNVIIKNFSSLEERVDKGAILENFVFRELIEHEVKYYRTKNGAKVDFVIDDATPVEIKSHLASLKISKSYRYFLENYTPKRGYVLNFDQIGSKVHNGVKIDFLPHFMAGVL